MNRWHRILLFVFAIGAVLMVNVMVVSRRYTLHTPSEVLSLTNLPLIVRAVGTLEAKASVALRVPFDGPIIQKRFKEGERVAAGQTLLAVSRERIRLEFQTKKDTLLNAQSDLTRAKRELRLQKTLFDKQAVAYSSVEEAQRGLVRSEQALRAAQEAFRLEQVRWNSDTVKAPFSGTVVRDYLGDDNQVLAGKDVLLLADVSEYTIKVRVDEMDIKRVQEGQTAKIRIPLYPKTQFDAVVTQIGTAIDSAGPGIPEIQVVLKLTSTQGMMLRPKLTAEARIATGETEPVLSIGREAIDNRTGSPRIWRLDVWRRLRPVPVVLGRSNPERVELQSGAQNGWRVCQRFDPEFRSGLRVLEGDPKANDSNPSARQKGKPVTVRRKSK